MSERPNDELYETQFGRSIHLSKRLGALAIGVALVGVSVAYYLVRKAGSSAKNSAEFAANAIVSAVEYDYEDSAQPISIERSNRNS